jgi:hypothetical protein
VWFRRFIIVSAVCWDWFWFLRFLLCTAVVFVLLSCCYGLPKAAMDRGVLVLVFGALAVCWCDLVLGELVCFRSGVIGMFRSSGGDGRWSVAWRLRELGVRGGRFIPTTLLAVMSWWW